MPDFPVRASDSLLDETEANPFFGKINTVSDLVLFMNAQPRQAVVKLST